MRNKNIRVGRVGQGNKKISLQLNTAKELQIYMEDWGCNTWNETVRMLMMKLQRNLNA